MKTTVTVEYDRPTVQRVGDLPLGTCYLKEHQLWIKQEAGYSLNLETFTRYQVRPLEVVEAVFSELRIHAKS